MLFIVFYCFAVYHLTQKPNLPFEQLPVSSSVQAINDIVVSNKDEIEFLSSKYRIGDVVDVTINKEGITQIYRVALISYYDTVSILVHSVVSFVIFLVGLFVYYAKKEDQAAKIFHFVSALVAISTVGVKTIYSVSPWWVGYFLCIIFFFAYSFLSVQFIHFIIVFPRSRVEHYRQWLAVLYGIALAVWGALSYTYLRVAASDALEGFSLFAKVSSFHYAFVFLTLLFGIGLFYRSFTTSQSLEEQKKLRWILFGLILGTAPFLFLWTLPQIFGPPLIPESMSVASLLIIPITFAISIVRYRLMDIDIVLNRSVVYAIVIVFLLASYTLFIAVVADLTHSSSPMSSAIAAVLVALLFEPLRRGVQSFVDRKFFRVQYNFREAQKKFFEEIKTSLSLKQLAEIVVRDVIDLIPVEKIGFFIVRLPTHRLELLAHQKYDILEHHAPRFEIENLRASLQLPIAIEGTLASGIQYEKADRAVFQRWGMVLVLPMVSEKNEAIGFLVVGQKKSQQRFTIEDVDLLRAVTIHSALAIERIQLQQKVLLEHAEAERLGELNRLKSYFVSSVSHDLKTPLTSIKMFAELLKTKRKLSLRQNKEYLEIIEGETERLSRLINNVLDFAKIERGVQEYHFTQLNLNDVVRNVVKLMQYQFRIKQFEVQTKIGKKSLPIKGDEDAIARSLVNLLTNAMKYSSKKKFIRISTFSRNGFVGVSVQDNGIGISDEERQKIFDAFYRVKDSQTQHAGGVGLGLSVVKHIMDAHSGTIEVESVVGKGSKFTLLFPLLIQ